MTATPVTSLRSRDTVGDGVMDRATAPRRQQSSDSGVHIETRPLSASRPLGSVDLLPPTDIRFIVHTGWQRHATRHGVMAFNPPGFAAADVAAVAPNLFAVVKPVDIVASGQQRPR